ncbi:MAG: TetR/AcrR family transcriptional regulator [Actinomycetota bacterium]
MPRSKERTPELRERILDHALALLAEEGVSGVTTRAVAARAGTSAPAIYELFGDKAGLVRALFFEGYERLVARFADLRPPTGRPGDIVDVAVQFRAFALDHPHLFEVMYTRPFASFAPGPEEHRMGAKAQAALVDRATRCVEAGTLRGDPVDISHALLGLGIGLATQETAGWLGRTVADRDRRWERAIDALLAGYSA